MAEATKLRTEIHDVVAAEYEPLLAAALEATRNQHEQMIEAAVDLAVAAVERGAASAAGNPEPKARTPRKPRADKGHKRIGKGLPASEPSSAADSKPTEPACAECDHFASLHEGGTGECGIHGCGCETFIGESEIRP